MKWNLLDGDNTIMQVEAVDEYHAWKIVKKAGIHNKSNMFELMAGEE
jgi:hypothetical protein